MNRTDDPSIDNSVKDLDDIIISETNKNNNAIPPKDPDSQDNNTPSGNLSQGSSSETESPIRSPFIRKYGENNFIPSREVIKYIHNIAGINTSDISKDISKKISDIMSNLEALCSNSKPSGTHCNTFMMNMQNIFNLEVDATKTLRGKIRKDTALGIVEKQQFRDIWGAYVLDKAKKTDCMCYLCGLPIVENAPPEMEHKTPSPVMFTTIMHYRQMTMFYAEDPNTSQDSVYTRWNNFIKSHDNNANLLRLYNLINGTSIDYPENEIDNLFDTIFETFLPTIPYIQAKEKRDFFRYLIKYWLLGFAYSHHLCNQSKSELPICTDNKYYTAFTGSVSNRLKNKSSDIKTQQEANIIQSNVVTNIEKRQPRTCAMFAHMSATRDKALDKYTTISTVFDDSCNGYQKMISVIVVRSMLALLHRNKVILEQGATSSRDLGTAIMMETYSEPEPEPKQARIGYTSETINERITDAYLVNMDDLKIEIDKLEDDINNLQTEINNLQTEINKITNGRQTRSITTNQPILQKKQTELQTELQTKKATLQNKQTAYENLHKPIDVINDEEDNSLMNTIKTKIQTIINNICVISGGKRRKTRRRRMGKRSRVRRSSRSGSKKTRKRRVRKTVRKRR